MATRLDRLGCQVCLEHFHNVGLFKTHIRGMAHREQMAEVFPKEKSNYGGFFCNINLYAYIHGHEQRPSIVGLAMVTMCLSSEQRSLFYLCHLCDKICTEGMIVDHLISPEHYISYFNYTDPDVLSFAWLPSMSMLNGLRLGAFEENKKIGHGVLQVLDLPKDQFNCIRDLCYAKAMSTLEENVNLALKLKDRMPTRMSLQSYIAKPSRKHTLIGLQHLVECVCDGESEKSFHLCTLCQTTLRRNTVINHVISFDHLYCYINSWHPSSLGPKHSYLRYSTNFNSAMCQYAKQVVERGGTETNIKQVTLAPDVFHSLDESYSNVMDTISRECNGLTLITTIQPADPLEGPAATHWTICCQNCKTDVFLSKYTHHVGHRDHVTELRNIFGSAVADDAQKVYPPFLKLCNMDPKSKQTILGVQFVVACISSKVKTPACYICFACSKCFSDGEAKRHMHSQSHALNSVLLQKMPFAWDFNMDVRVLGRLALEEQQANRDYTLKVFDIPSSKFSKFTNNFFGSVEDVIERHELCSVQRNLRDGVQCEPNLKHGYPMLGQDFVVNYSTRHGANVTKWTFLCLLCGRKLGGKEISAHVVSHEHVRNFLKRAHRGTLDSDDVSREILLDLAEQAAKIHPVSEIQIFSDLKVPIWFTDTYAKTVQVLQQCHGELYPVLAAGKPLVPTKTLQKVDGGHSEEKAQVVNKKTTTEGGKSAVSTAPPRPTPPKIEPSSPTETTHGGLPGGATRETMKEAEEKQNKATADGTSKSHSICEPEGNTNRDSHPAEIINEESKEKKEEDAELSEVAPLQTGKNIKQETPEPVEQELNKPENGGEKAQVAKRTESALMQTCSQKVPEKVPDTVVSRTRKVSGRSDQEMACKRQCLVYLGDETQPLQKPPECPTGMDHWNAKVTNQPTNATQAVIVPTSYPAASSILWNYIKRTNREPVIGLQELFECHCEPYAPLYFCKCCSMQIPEKTIVAHITGYVHQKGYLKLIITKRALRTARRAAVKHEALHGIGEAEVVQLTPKVYHEIVNQSYDCALKNMQACQNPQQGSPQVKTFEELEAPTPCEAQQPSQSVALSPTFTTTFLVCGTGKTTQVLPKTGQQAESPENKATSAPTLKRGATVKISRTDATSPTVKISRTDATSPTVKISRTDAISPSKSVVAEIWSPAKPPKEKLIAAPSIKPVDPLPSQSSVTVLKPPVTSSKSIPSTKSMSTTVSSGAKASKPPPNPLRAPASSNKAAPTATPHSGNVVHMQPPPVPTPPTNGTLFSKPPGEQSSASAKQALGSVSPTTPVYGPPAFPSNYTAVDKSCTKSQPVVGTDRLVAIMYEKRRQSYCMLCSVRLKNKDHMTSKGHRYKYVQLRYPDWTMEGEMEIDEKKMLKMVIHLAEIEKEKGINIKTLEVNCEVYKRLAAVSEEEAITAVKELLELSIPAVEGATCVSGSHEVSHSAHDHNQSTPGDEMTPAPKMDTNTNNVPGVCEPEVEKQLWIEVSPEITENEEESDKVPHHIATGLQVTHTLPSLAGELEEPKMYITQHHPALPREPKSPMAEPDRSPSANSTQNEETASENVPRMEPIGDVICGPSHLSTFLRMSYSNKEPIIGLAFVFECRGISQGTFCLCGSCRKMFPIKLMCQHIVSREHQHTYLLEEYPQFTRWWGWEFPPEHKDELLRDIAWKISEREFYDEMDAQVILLHKDYYDYIRTSTFSQALDMLQNISREKQLNGLFVPQTSGTPTTREPRLAKASKESNARNMRDGELNRNYVRSFAKDTAQLNERPQDTVKSEPALPVVGMCAIVECSCDAQTPFYLCVACGNILSQGMMLLHVQRPRHLQKYLSVRYPTRFEEVVWTAEVGVLTAELLQRAKELLEQNLDEPGTMQRIPLPLEEFKMIRTMTFDKALSRLHTIYRNQSQSELLTCVTSKPQPAVEHPSEDGSDQLRGVKRRRLASPPPDGVTLLPAERSHTMENEKKEIRGASKLISSQANSFPALVPASFSESSQAAAVSLVSLSHDPDKGAGPGAHIPVKADNGSLVKMAPDKGKYLEAAGSSKDKTKCNSKPGLKKSSTTCSPNHNTESKAFSSYPVQSQVCSSVPSATNCSAGRFAEPVSRVAVIRGASNPHAENTADPCALLPQQDPGFQGYFRLKQTQTGTNPNSSASSTFQLLTEPAPTVSSGPIESIGGLATNLSTTACSSISASTQSNPFTYNITEETPAMAGTQGYSTGQSYYPLSSYHTNALTPSMSVYRAPYNPPFYPANMNHNAMGTPRVGPPNQGFQAPMFGGLVHHGSGQLASQLPRPCMVMASQYLSWQGVTPATEYGEMASAYHGPASYSQGLQRASTNGNNMVISNPSRHHSISNLLEFQGVQATTHYNCTSAAIPRVVTSEGHPQGVATFDFSNDAADGTD